VEDFKGLKISVNNESPVGTALMKTLGAEPMPLSKDSPKLDGFETTYARFVEMDQKTQDSKKVINDLQHSLFLTTILINKEFMASLPPEYQQAVRHAAGTAAVLERKDSIQDGVDLQKKFAAEGYHVVKMTAAEQRKFKESTQPVYTKFEPMLGKDLIKSIRED
jgi:TRAP-type C4-dicarboxylate transport system substrate-binding protein